MDAEVQGMLGGGSAGDVLHAPKSGPIAHTTPIAANVFVTVIASLYRFRGKLSDRLGY
jgi:hypothetical protein